MIHIIYIFIWYIIYFYILIQRIWMRFGYAYVIVFPIRRLVAFVRRILKQFSLVPISCIWENAMVSTKIPLSLPLSSTFTTLILILLTFLLGSEVPSSASSALSVPDYSRPHPMSSLHENRLLEIFWDRKSTKSTKREEIGIGWKKMNGRLTQ